ncbi:xyloside xylosyltransferase 1 [Epinephelus moara]|uniref:xyloside xylosyltransferase 1 n=1 Tax=Epinephelus moara TaxID=300413 RepID=UPI00214E1036|nr:xyloside xylosyltransferase 1 [Epinephelus moara]XP_049911295.1 xyloside xylosyltransferase 1 [Epinephelus moara]XP_049911296.1 xyloside xylosyltransferase 1 [Epinephelus moara]XP_049911297.1 xyloside xylosyltransferase 1 [Epinephelus moara]XP_049911298.1 xyloside xylosyltransferase 1 [Epinephelus moara]XP_049911299.1 xyloside xylosyltransferase 1 [Epinephelus moara]XP_049911300.1 xyloside xylosyltransferase 1 [Epinephelus moara]
MGILRLVARIMGRISTFRSYQFVLLLAAALAVVAFYYFGSEKQNFSSTTKRIKQTQASHNANRNDADLTVDTRLSQMTGSEEQGEEEQDVGGESDRFGPRKGDGRYHALMMFTKVDKSRSLQDKFKVAMLSMVKHGRFMEGEVLVLHFVSDEASKELGERMLQEFLLDATFKHEVLFHDVVALTQKLFPIVEAMQKHFSAGSGAYYSDAIFFLSVAMHHIMPESLTRIVQLDLDLKYRTNIRDLFQEFDQFPPGAVIGIAREMQPVYRHTFWQYRKENPQTKVGDPPPEGLPGFNSGVMLLDLGAMRDSALYNQLLKPSNVAKLADQYRFRGHLGDQDFFTMIGMEHPQLFHSLACGWNRQLCTWWRDHGYGDVFQMYYRCDGPVYIYHGNCNSPIPDD